MTDLYVFKTAENPDFLVGPRVECLHNEDRERFEEIGKEFMGKLKQHYLGADYPYLALMYDVILDTDTLCFIRPDSWRLGGIRGGLQYWSYEYDASKPEGLARMIHEELSQPDNPSQRLKPITCVIDFIGSNPVIGSAYELLNSQYGYDIKYIDLSE